MSEKELTDDELQASAGGLGDARDKDARVAESDLDPNAQPVSGWPVFETPSPTISWETSSGQRSS